MFYTYSQNNSGGSFDIDHNVGISVYVVIEADSPKLADSKAEALGLYFDGEGDCSCCGDRWSNASSYNEAEVPTVHGDPIQDHDFYGKFEWKWVPDGPEAYVHFADGRVQGYGLPKRGLS